MLRNKTMFALSEYQAKLSAPGLVDRTICASIINQAFKEAGLDTNWMNLTTSEKRKLGNKMGDVWSFLPEIQEAIKTHFTVDTLMTLEDWAREECS